MAQNYTIGKGNTTVTTCADGSKLCTLHSTAVVQWWPERRKVVFQTGGWRTATTRTRMNQACNQWGIPLHVSFAQSAKNEVRNHQTGQEYQFDAKGVCEVTY